MNVTNKIVDPADIVMKAFIAKDIPVFDMVDYEEDGELVLGLEIDSDDISRSFDTLKSLGFTNLDYTEVTDAEYRARVYGNFPKEEMK